MKEFTNSQIKTLVDICVGIGIVCLGSVSIPVAFNTGASWLTVYGLVIGLAFWYIAIRVSRNIHEP